MRILATTDPVSLNISHEMQNSYFSHELTILSGGTLIHETCMVDYDFREAYLSFKGAVELT